MEADSLVAQQRRSAWCKVAISVSVALLGLLCLAGTVGAASDRLIYGIEGCCSVGPGGGTLIEADTVTAENRVVTTIKARGPNEGGVPFVLSPNGQRIAYEASGEAIKLSNLDGTIQTTVITGATLLSFDPTGSKLLIAGAFPGPGACPGLCWINLDGSGLATITTASKRGSVSSDGTHVTWSASVTSHKETANQIFVANANGTSPKQTTAFTSKTTPSGAEVWEAPQYGPNNTIAFFGNGSSSEDLWLVKDDGTGLKRVPNAFPTWFSWTPAGQLNVTMSAEHGCGLYTINPDGTGLTRIPVSANCKLHPGEIPKAVYRQPSSTVGTFDALAARYEPVLRFDTSEQWRPLNVESFFAENQHHLCEGGSCEATALKSAADLNKKRTSSAYINVAGTLPSEGGGAETYHSPYSECTTGGLRDCDGGSRSAIYYRSPGVYSGYEYIDYWYLYRANYFLEGVDFHEGDWEGATVAPSLTGDSFDYAAFSQHGTFYSYLRSELRCEDSPSASLPERGTCSSLSGRIDDLVANGDHANYTTPCKEELPTSCQQNGEGHFEAGYDGAKRWGNAYEPADLLAMPAVGSTSWTNWPGKWGSPSGGIEEGDGPASPGNQTFKVECASIDNEPGCETGPRTASVHPLDDRDGTAASPGLTAVACANWMGEGVAAIACNPKELRHAVLAGQIGTEGTMHISIAGEKGSSASGRGIAQYAGQDEVRNGSQIRVDGPVTNGTEVLVHVYDRARHRMLLASFALAATGAAHSARIGHRTLRLAIQRTRRGRLTLRLGHARAKTVSTVR